MIDSLVFFSENLTLQNAPGAKVQRIEIQRFWWPMKRGISFLSHSWLTRAVHGLRPKPLPSQGFNTIFKTFSDNIRHLLWPTFISAYTITIGGA